MFTTFYSTVSSIVVSSLDAAPCACPESSKTSPGPSIQFFLKDLF